MQRTRILTRFGGLFFFVLALIVVGLLVFLTIKSARENDQKSNNFDTTINDSQTNETASNQNQNNSGDAVAANDNSDPQATSTSENETASDQTDDQLAVSGPEDQTEDLPGTGPETDVIALLSVVIIGYVLANYLNSRKILHKRLLSGE